MRFKVKQILRDGKQILRDGKEKNKARGVINSSRLSSCLSVFQNTRNHFLYSLMLSTYLCFILRPLL